MTFACELEDTHGGLVADLSSSLSRGARPEDLIDLKRLLHADVERWNAIRAAQASNKRVQLTGWERVHLRALLTLRAPNTDEVLISLLNIDHYVHDTAKALLELAQIEPELSRPFSRESFGHLWLPAEGRRVARFEEARRLKYAAALRSCLEQHLLRVRATGRPEDHARFLHELGVRLAELDGAASSQLILECVAIPDRWGMESRRGPSPTAAFGRDSAV